MSDLEQAETECAKAKEQIEKWSTVAHLGSFHREQVQMWIEVYKANRWSEPGRG